jgi:DNA repair protein RecO (recombination protein O)
VTEIISTEGVVLRRRDFGETSRIAVVYTRDAGKVQLLAKGARIPKNKFGAALEPLSRGEFVFYWRESKDLFTLTETAAVLPGRFIREDAKALPYGLAMAEATDKLSGEGDPDAGLYELVASSLAALDRGGPGAALLSQFLIKLATRLGLKPDIGTCAACGRLRPSDGVALELKEGTVLCRDCQPAVGDFISLSPATYSYVNTLISFEPSRLGLVKAGPEIVEQTLSFIRAHLHYHTALEIKSLALTSFF